MWRDGRGATTVSEQSWKLGQHPKGHMESPRAMEVMSVNASKEGPSCYPPIFSPGTNTMLHSRIAGSYGSQAMDRSGNQRMSLE